MNTKLIPWSLAIFAARETPEVLARCVRAAIVACGKRQASLDVLINGNLALAKKFAEMAKDLDGGGAKLRVWAIEAPDKAHTWNEYVYRIWDNAGTAFFIDGYAQVRPDALAAIDHRLMTTPDALGASGVPTSGRSAAALREQMLRQGGIHGNLYAISEEGMQGIRAAGFKLPLGIYRTDPLIGSVLMFRLDPSNNTWDPRRIAVESSATWHVDGIEDLTLKNVKSHFKRILRQAQGDLENRAARDHLAVRGLPLTQMPKTVREMVLQWIDAHPDEARSLYMKNPLRLHAARRMRPPQDWSSAKRAPELLYGAPERQRVAANLG
ncbi:hypothetical protein [Massilia consociata]|uniref:Uncharacterized protein n=1 Tax=Massilia consociata TaxID=760117 RepID=A0ABV6FBL3_9BURK